MVQFFVIFAQTPPKLPGNFGIYSSKRDVTNLLFLGGPPPNSSFSLPSPPLHLHSLPATFSSPKLPSLYHLLTWAPS